MDVIKKHKNKITLALLVISFVWAITSTYLLLTDYTRLHRGGFMPGPRAWHPHERHVATQYDVDALAPWMTFSFVNKIFNLPPSHFKNLLSITSTQYPNLTIESVAQAKSIQTSELLLIMKEDLTLVLSATSSTP